MLSHKPILRVDYEILGEKPLGKIHIPKKEDELIFKIFSKDGKLESIKRYPMRSYLANFARLLNCIFLGVDNSTSGLAVDKIIKAVTGGATYAATPLIKADVTEVALTASAQTAYGIWAGDQDNESGLGLTIETGVTGVMAYNDYMLRAKLLADGGSPDTGLEYRGVNLSISGETITLSRRFQNDSLVDIIISEVGVVGKSGTDYFMLIRDFMNDAHESQTVETTKIIEIDYSFTIDSLSGWTKNYLRFLTSVLKAGNALEQVKDTLGSLYTVNFTSADDQARMDALAADDTFGIVIGGLRTVPSTLVPLSTDGYRVDNKLTESDLAHGAVEPIALTTLNNNSSFGLQRDFENTGTSTYYVTNSGLYINEAAASHIYMLARTNVTNPLGYQQVNPGNILRVKYTLDFPLENW